MIEVHVFLMTDQMLLPPATATIFTYENEPYAKLAAVYFFSAANVHKVVVLKDEEIIKKFT